MIVCVMSMYALMLGCSEMTLMSPLSTTESKLCVGKQWRIITRLSDVITPSCGGKVAYNYQKTGGNKTQRFKNYFSNTRRFNSSCGSKTCYSRFTENILWRPLFEHLWVKALSRCRLSASYLWPWAAQVQNYEPTVDKYFVQYWHAGLYHRE